MPPTMNAPLMRRGTGRLCSPVPQTSRIGLLEHQRRAERQQQAVFRLLAVGAPQQEFERRSRSRRSTSGASTRATA